MQGQYQERKSNQSLLIGMGTTQYPCMKMIKILQHLSPPMDGIATELVTKNLLPQEMNTLRGTQGTKDLEHCVDESI